MTRREQVRQKVGSLVARLPVQKLNSKQVFVLLLAVIVAAGYAYTTGDIRLPGQGQGDDTASNVENVEPAEDVNSSTQNQSDTTGNRSQTNTTSTKGNQSGG
ncbi:MAG: hypothetical protein ABEJ56_00140 [Candidatus Nanohaloarchaea archaeon]